MKPDPDNNFCLKFCRLDGNMDDLGFNFSVVDLILYLGLYLGFFKVFIIKKDKKNSSNYTHICKYMSI